VGRDPTGATTRPGHAEVYVAVTGAARVAVVNTAAQEIAARIPVGVRPFFVEFSPDGRTAYVANSASNSVSVIDCDARRLTATVRVATPAA
jgi:YVTN family beta-propeller protein